MEVRLRDYQANAVRELPLLLDQHGRVVAVSPTGSGKTTIAAAFLRTFEGRVLWVVHRHELVEQAIAHLERAGIRAKELGMLTGRETRNADARILVASVQMLALRPTPDVDLLVIDEAHHALAASYQRILRDHTGPVLGLTATPWRLDGQPLRGAFNHLYVMAETLQLIVDKHIAHAVCYGLPRGDVRKMLAEVKEGAHAFNERQLSLAMRKRTLVGDLVKTWERRAGGRTTVVFAVDCKHGRAIAARFAKAGHTVEYLDSDTKIEVRKAMLERFRSGVTRILVNVGILDEGFDCDAIECVVMARPTKSLTLYLQQVGRALRPHGDRRPIILDHAGNCNRFGLPELPREWSLDKRARAASSSGDGLTRCCPVCDTKNPISSSQCSECGASLLTERELEERDAELKKLEASKSEGHKSEQFFRNLAAERNLDEAWVQRALKGAA